MRVSRLYLPVTLQQGVNLELDQESAHYVRTVLRLKKAAAITVFNGDGAEWSGKLLEVHRKRVVIAIAERHERNSESPLIIHLGLAVLRSDRMDLAVQKAVELGVKCITPVITERCVVQFKGEKKQQKLQHWRKIVQHATEQSGRTWLPELYEIMELPHWLGDQEAGLKIFLDPYAKQSLPNLTPKNDRVTLLSGPEGGFSKHEKQSALNTGFTAIKMGNRILRAETAALAALAAVQVLWGDFA